VPHHAANHHLLTVSLDKSPGGNIWVLCRQSTLIEAALPHYGIIPEPPKSQSRALKHKFNQNLINRVGSTLTGQSSVWVHDIECSRLLRRSACPIMADTEPFRLEYLGSIFCLRAQVSSLPSKLSEWSGGFSNCLYNVYQRVALALTCSLPVLPAQDNTQIY